MTNRQIDAWSYAVKVVEGQGSIVMMQISPGGRIAWPEVNPARRVVAPSPVSPRRNNPLTGAPYGVLDEMPHYETAYGAIAAGFHGIEIHGANGYLISRFLSTYANRRTAA